MIKKQKKRKNRSSDRKSNRRIMELVILFIGGTALLLFLLKTGAEIAVPYSQDQLIAKYAKANKVEKSLVAAVIYQESRFRADAVSQTGASGLMQIMPETARWIAARTNQDYSRERLKEAEYNISMGTYYLGYLMERYNGKVETALAAYNAGPGKVDSWLEDSNYSKNGVLTRIPFEETRNYVETVLKMQEVYRKLYVGRFTGGE